MATDKTSSSAPVAQAQQPAPAPAAPTNPSATSAPVTAPAAASAPVNVTVNFLNESGKKPEVPPEKPAETFSVEVYQPVVGGGYARIFGKTTVLESALKMSPGINPGQVEAYQTSCLKPTITPEEEQAKGAAPYKKGIMAVLVGLLVAGLITFMVLWLCGAGCGGHNDVPPTPAQTIVVQPAPAPVLAPACDPVVVSPVVVPAPVVNVAVPETKVIYRTTVREVPAPVAPPAEVPPQGPSNVRDTARTADGGSDGE